MEKNTNVLDALETDEVLDLIDELIDKVSELETMDDDDLDQLEVTDRIMVIVETLTNEVISEKREDQKDQGEVEDTSDPEWEREKVELNNVIRKEHTLMADPKLKDVLLPIYERNKDNEERMKVISEAVRAWAEFAIELTQKL